MAAAATRSTVTDAAVVLGYIDTGNFAGGSMNVARDLAEAALSGACGRALSAFSVEEAARAVFDVLISRTASSIKEMMLERGLACSANSSMLGFGGCGRAVRARCCKERVWISRRARHSAAALGLLGLGHAGERSLASAASV